MFFQEGAQEQAEVLDEVLLVVLPVGVGQPDVGVQGQHLNADASKLEENSTPEPDASVLLLTCLS